MDRIKRFQKTPEFTAIVSALVMGYLTHNFALTNVMHNIDDIGNQPYGYGMGLDMGRWLLTVLGDFAEVLGAGRNLHYINGILFIVLIAISAAFVVSSLKIHSCISASLIGMLFAVFPSGVIALTYRFTSVYYGLSLLMAVGAAWVIHRYRNGFLLSAVLIAASLGIYQAYVSFPISIWVLLLIRQALTKEKKIWPLVKQGLMYCLTLGLGLLIYFICLKLCLKIYGMSLSSSQGVESMGNFALMDIPRLIVVAFKNFCKFPLMNYCGLAGLKLIKIAYLFLGVFSIVLIAYIMMKSTRDKWYVLFAGLMCLIFPVAVNFIQVMAPDSWIYTMMVYSFTLVGCVPLTLLECCSTGENRRIGGRVQKAAVAAVAILICSYSYQANINYTSNYFINRQVENYISSIVTQVRMTDGFSPDKKWVMIGKIRDPLLNSSWEYEPKYDGVFDTERTLNDISQYYWFWTYVGYRLPMADTDTVASLRYTSEVKSMPCWPAEGSIKVIGDNVVLKFED